MISPTLNSIRETFLNPAGRFRTLEGIYGLRDPQGEFLMRASNRMASVEAVCKGRRYTVKCLYEGEGSYAPGARLFASRMAGRELPFLTGWEYLPEEMLLIDERGHGRYYDVVLQGVPAGVRLDHHMRALCLKSDRENMMRAAHSVARFSELAMGHRFVSARVRPPHFYMSPSLDLVAVNYEQARLMTEAELAADPGAREIYDLRLTGIGVAIYLMACQPDLYEVIHAAFSISVDRVNSYGAALLEWAKAEKRDALASIMQYVMESGGKNAGPAHGIPGRLYTLAQSVPLPSDSLAAVFGGRPVPVHVLAEPGAEYTAGVKDPAGRTIHSHGGSPRGLPGPDGKYRFPQAEERSLREMAFDYAGDFEEGRAVVETGGYYGLIDLQGKYVLQPVCEEVIWDKRTGIARIMTDGRWQLADRTGRKLTGADYEWMGEYDSDRIPVKLPGGKYGYIDSKGETAIAFRFDDAYSFHDGTATVEVEGRLFDILPDGTLAGNS